MLIRYPKRRIRFVALLLLVFLQGCFRVRFGAPSLPPVRDIGPVATETQDQLPDALPTVLVPSPTLIPTETLPTATLLPKVTITAVKGNLFIRRGPDMAYNPIGVLYKDTSAEAVARDVLSAWAQIVMPNSKNTGWVSVQTNYSSVQGDLKSLPEFTITDWPNAAYLRNCTHHEMYIQPGEIRLPSYLEYPENEMTFYPGIYTIYDLDLPNLPEVMKVDIREGSDIEIKIDGAGEKRKCP